MEREVNVRQGKEHRFNRIQVIQKLILDFFETLFFNFLPSIPTHPMSALPFFCTSDRAVLSGEMVNRGKESVGSQRT